MLSTVNIIGDEEIVTLLTVTDTTKSPVTTDAAVKVVNASARTTAVKITGNASANTIISGKGNDLFVYSGGKDVITDYAVGDKISLGAAISDTAVSGNNVVFTVGSGSLTINNAKGKSSTTTINDVVTVSNSTKSPVTVAPYVKTISASARTTAVQITGNDLANTISGGTKNDSLYGGKGADKLYGDAGNDKIHGGAGNDTLAGGKGNDSLWGDAGKDTFIYGGGKDVIYGFENDDLLQITGAFSASYNKSAKSIAFKVGSGSVTLKDFGTTTTFHVNDSTYQLTKGKFCLK